MWIFYSTSAFPDPYHFPSSSLVPYLADEYQHSVHLRSASLGRTGGCRVNISNICLSSVPLTSDSMVRLSGIVTVQSFVYVKLYPTDQIHTKSIVSLIQCLTFSTISYWRLVKVAAVWYAHALYLMWMLLIDLTFKGYSTPPTLFLSVRQYGTILSYISAIAEE